MSLHHDTAITWLGHATVLIETSGGKRLLVDPWLAGNPACPPEWKDISRLGRLDMILVTHLHNDHAGDVAAVVRANPDADVVAMFEACNYLVGDGAGNARPMGKGGSQVLHGIRITMTHAIHSSSFTESGGTVIYGGEPAGFVLHLENRFTIYAAGDTGVFGDMSLIRDLYHPELALLPIGDLFTMGPVEAVAASRMLGVRHVIPIHYGTFPALTGTPEEFMRHAAEIPGLQVHVLAPGSTLT